MLAEMPLTPLLPCAWTEISAERLALPRRKMLATHVPSLTLGIPFRGGLVSMRAKWIRNVLVGLALSAVLGAHGSAQSGSEESKRKVKTKVAPVYPELAKRMNVSGR